MPQAPAGILLVDELLGRRHRLLPIERRGAAGSPAMISGPPVQRGECHSTGIE